MALKNWDDSSYTDGDIIPNSQWVAHVDDQKARIEKSKFTSAASLLTSTGASGVTELAVGTAGKILAVGTGATTLEWITAPLTNATHTGDVTGSEELTIADGAVDIGMMSASGTADSTTYLRGDNTWATPEGGSGDVATDTIWDAAGDLAIGTGADTAAKLSIGANGYVLTSNGTTATWAAAGGGGAGNTILTFAMDGALSTGTKTFYIIPDELNGLDIKEVRLACLGLPTGANVTVDVTKNGTATTDSVFTSDVPIAMSTAESATNGLYQSATGTVSRVGTPGTTLDAARDTIATDDVLYVIVRQVGSTLTGSDMRVQITFG
jgi:hypothetical protein